jgi:hypothetical protein
VLDEIIEHATNQASQENAGQENQEIPLQENANTENQEISTSVPASEVIPQETPKSEETPKKTKKAKAESEEATLETNEVKSFLEMMDEEEPEEKGDSTDYKALYEQTQQELSKYKNPILERLADVLDNPELDIDKFFDSHKPKDLKNLDLEELWVMNKRATSEVDWTDEELEEAFAEEMESIGESSFKRKSLKENLIKTLRGKIEVEKEPEYVSLLRQKTTENKEAMTKAKEYNDNMLTNIRDTADSFKGVKIVGDLAISEEHIQKVKQTLDPAYYTNKDGSINVKKIVNDRIMAAAFTDILSEYQKVIQAETKREIVRPNPNSMQGENLSATERDLSMDALNSVIKNKSLLKNVK